MKNIVFLISFLFTLTSFSQICNQGQSLVELNTNNINATLRLGGDMFFDGTTNKFIVNAKSGGPQVSSLSATALWMSGFDVGGNLKVAAQTYRVNGLSYRPYGNSQSNCNNWDKHWKVNKENILNHIADWKDNNIIDNKQDLIYGWPGVGNPHFKSLNNFDLTTKYKDLAPFHDTNNDNIYNPDDGDYPALIDDKSNKEVIPDQIIWYTFNDNSIDLPNIFMVIQVTSWAFNSNTEEVLNNTIFTKHTLIYESIEPIHLFKAAIWSDMDLGCPEDDYIGCNKDLSCFYVYNADSLDGTTNITCSGINTFGDDPGVQSITFLSDSLSSFIYDNGIQSNPPAKQSIEFYRLMNSMFKDGTHLKNEGDGYANGINSEYAFDGNPNNPQEWSMKSASLNPKDQRVIGSVSFGTLLPGDIRSFTTAYSYFNVSKSTNTDLDSMFTGVKKLHDIYDDFFIDYKVSTTDVNNENILIAPNPANNFIRISNEKGSNLEITIFDIYGRKVMKTQTSIGNTNIDVNSLQSGTYIIHVKYNNISFSQKLIIIK